MEDGTVQKQVSTWRRQHILSISLVVLVFFQNLGSARAKVVLPVLRSFSQLNGSGLHEGADGMTSEHAQELKDHDFQRSQRHRRMVTAVADFPLYGSLDQIGLYYTELVLGTPTKKYQLQVDTGSDLLWVNCQPCSKCPMESIPPNVYEPQETSTGRNVSCSSADCKILGNSFCIDRSCYYGITYGDGSTTKGYLVEDVLTFSTKVGNNTVENATTDIVFGCAFDQTGISPRSSDRRVDGILGFGPQVLSVVSQLADSGLTTNEFAHCLQGDTGDGGLFVVGDVEEPGLVYTQMLPNKYHYNVNLQAISVGGTMLNIDSNVFASNGDVNGGTIFDSGTTLALLVDEAFYPLLQQLLSVVMVKYVSMEGTICFNHPSRFVRLDQDIVFARRTDWSGILTMFIAEFHTLCELTEYTEWSRDVQSVFPSVTLYFDGGAEMSLKPENYLYLMQVTASSPKWCLAWSPSSSYRLALTIFGDIVLKDKLVVYDIENQQIGWMDFDCERSFAVFSPTSRWKWLNNHFFSR